MTDQDHYQLLGVPRDADAARISRAWRKRTRSAGPGSPEFTKLNAAAETLLDPGKRAEYDAALPAPVEVPPAAKGAPVPAPPTAGHDVAEEAVPPRRASTAQWVVLGGLGVLALAAVVLAAVLFGRHRTDQEVATARQEAPAAAQQAMQAVLAYDYRKMGPNLATDLSFMTPKYGAEFKKSFGLLTQTSGSNASPVDQTKTVVTAQIQGTAVMDASANRVNVLVFANQSWAHQTTPAKQGVLYDRIKVAMVKQGSDWLIDNIQTG